MGLTSGILQTPEFFIQKGAYGEMSIGSHLLIAIPFVEKEGKGIVFGTKFDQRCNQPMQWIKPITPSIIMAGFGEYANFRTIFQHLNDAAQGMTELVGESYVSLHYISQICSSLMKQQFESSVPFSLDVLLIDALSQDLHFVNLYGNVMLLKNFGILGGYQYLPQKLPENASFEDFQKSVVFPRKNTIRHLEKELIKKPILNKKMATKILTEAIFRFDPPSKKETFEFVVFQNQIFKFLIIKRNKAK